MVRHARATLQGKKETELELGFTLPGFPVLRQRSVDTHGNVSVSWLTNGSSSFGSGQAGAVPDAKHIWVPRVLEGVFVEVQPSGFICQFTPFHH